jgi:NAD-dependent DNA ligase
MAKVLGLKGFGIAVVDSLVKEEYVDSLSCVFDIFGPEADPGPVPIPDGIARNLRKEMAKCTSVPLHVFLASLGIPALGAQTSKNVAARFQSLEKVRAAGPSQFAEIEGVGDVSASSIHEGLEQCSKEISDLLSHLAVTPHQNNNSSAGKSGPVICLSGTFSGGKAQIHSTIENMGGTVTSSVTAKTDLLIVDNPDSQSSKVKKAKKFQSSGGDIKIILLEELDGYFQN